MIELIVAMILLVVALIGLYKVVQYHKIVYQRAERWVNENKPVLVHSNSGVKELDVKMTDTGKMIPAYSVKVTIDKFLNRYYLFDMGFEFYELDGLFQYYVAQLTVSKYGLPGKIKSLDVF